jgi:DNA mismatch repair protein MutS2
MKHDLLEFSVLKEYIKPFISSEIGLSALEALRPSDSWEDARHRLALLQEMMALMDAGRAPAIAAITDIRPLLSIREGSVLEGQDLVRVSSALRDMARLKRELAASGGLLAEAVFEMEPLDHVSGRIDAMLLPPGEIADDAYPFLRDLRSRYRAVRTSILEKLDHLLDRLKTKSVLMEELITKRNDRYVIPVRHDYHVHMKGIIHDYSRTNRTAYVEPLTVVEDNNHLNQIKSQILEEEHKVLRELTALVHDEAPIISENLKSYGSLDLVFANGSWAVSTGGTIPRIQGEEIRLDGARHPILIERLGRASTVALDIRMPEGKDCLVITGPNAGGKTVALKTLGLLILMARSGLAIPAGADSVIAPVGTIWVEMDTNQDITHDLSSFTAHALSLKNIYAQAGPGDLVLLDEPGSGTDHDQGGALAVSCIDALRRKGARVVVTSHSDLVKLYGITRRASSMRPRPSTIPDSGLYMPCSTGWWGRAGRLRSSNQ